MIFLWFFEIFFVFFSGAYEDFLSCEPLENIKWNSLNTIGLWWGSLSILPLVIVRSFPPDKARTTWDLYQALECCCSKLKKKKFLKNEMKNFLVYKIRFRLGGLSCCLWISQKRWATDSSMLLASQTSRCARMVFQLQTEKNQFILEITWNE